MKIESKKGKGERLLDRVHDLTREVNTLLESEDLDMVMDKLKQRELVLSALLKLESDVEALSERRPTIQQILSIDKENMNLINAQLDGMYKAIVNSENERQSVNSLRSISKIGQKHIVDFLH